MRQGFEAHRGADEVWTRLEVAGAQINGRADFVKEDRIVELKISNPVFWRSHTMQASLYAHSLSKKIIDIEYRNLGLNLVGRPVEMSRIQETVERMKEDTAKMAFQPNKRSCYFCGYKQFCQYQSY